MTQVNDSSGVRTGSGNLQINLFAGEHPRGNPGQQHPGQPVLEPPA
jgi:hypothetical protein